MAISIPPQSPAHDPLVLFRIEESERAVSAPPAPPAVKDGSGEPPTAGGVFGPASHPVIQGEEIAVTGSAAGPFALKRIPVDLTPLPEPAVEERPIVMPAGVRDLS